MTIVMDAALSLPWWERALIEPYRSRCSFREGTGIDEDLVLAFFNAGARAETAVSFVSANSLRVVQILEHLSQDEIALESGEIKVGGDVMLEGGSAIPLQRQYPTLMCRSRLLGLPLAKRHAALSVLCSAAHKIPRRAVANFFGRLLLGEDAAHFRAGEHQCPLGIKPNENVESPGHPRPCEGTAVAAAGFPATPPFTGATGVRCASCRSCLARTGWIDGVSARLVTMVCRTLLRDRTLPRDERIALNRCLAALSWHLNIVAGAGSGQEDMHARPGFTSQHLRDGASRPSVTQRARTDAASSVPPTSRRPTECQDHVTAGTLSGLPASSGHSRRKGISAILGAFEGRRRVRAAELSLGQAAESDPNDALADRWSPSVKRRKSLEDEPPPPPPPLPLPLPLDQGSLLDEDGSQHRRKPAVSAAGPRNSDAPLHRTEDNRPAAAAAAAATVVERAVAREDQGPKRAGEDAASMAGDDAAKRRVAPQEEASYPATRAAPRGEGDAREPAINARGDGGTGARDALKPAVRAEVSSVAEKVAGVGGHGATSAEVQTTASAVVSLLHTAISSSSPSCALDARTPLERLEQQQPGGALETVCRELGLDSFRSNGDKGCGDDLVMAVCNAFVTPALSLRNSLAFVRAVLVPRVRSLTAPASRLLVTAVSRIGTARPGAVIDGLILPLLCDGNRSVTGPAQCELCTRLIKQVLPKHTLESVIVGLCRPRPDGSEGWAQGGDGEGSLASTHNSCAWTEHTMPVITAALNLKPPLSHDAIAALVRRIEHASEQSQLQTSLKFTTLVHGFVTRHGQQLKPFVAVLRSAITRCSTFMVKAVLAALQRLEK